MVSLLDQKANPYVKLICMGDSGTGKTGSLESLVRAGYRLRILDMDNGTQPLATFIAHNSPDKAEELLSSVLVESFRDEEVASIKGPKLKSARAFEYAMKTLTAWSDETVPAEWGPDHILVIDSLTMLGRAAFNFARFAAPGAKDPRQWYFSAQQAIESIIAMVTSPDFHTNVIITAHVTIVETQDGVSKGYPSSIGKAFAPHVVKYFSNIVLFQSSGTGRNFQRQITTVPTAVIDLKNAAPFRLDNTLSIEEGMAQIFATLKE